MGWGEGPWEGLGCTASASLLLGQELQPEHTLDKIYFPQAR